MVAALLKTIPEVKGIMVFLPSLIEVVSIYKFKHFQYLTVWALLVCCGFQSPGS
jgi:hypothetical protein